MDVKSFFIYLYKKRKSIKYPVLNVLKLICFIVFVYQIILLTIDYLSFPYSVKLDIIDDKQVLPAVTICSNHYFTKEKIKSYFNITDEFYRVSQQNSNISNKYFEEIFYRKYLNKILDEFSVKKLEFTISAKDLFNCSANLHEFRNLERKLISKCEENTTVIESLYYDFGKCFTYFGDISFERESIIFLNRDFIQFEAEFDEINKIVEIESLFILTHSPRNLNFQTYDAYHTSHEVSRDIRFRMTQISYLSWPYEHDCYEYSGKILTIQFFTSF
jgi:hypothetical protein